MIAPDDLPEHLQPAAPLNPAGAASTRLISLDELTREHVTRVLAAADGNKTRAAEILGVDRRTLYRMLKRYGLGRS
jgi:transcriptional regulator of acetoin/glycerol metabolism